MTASLMTSLDLLNELPRVRRPAAVGADGWNLQPCLRLRPQVSCVARGATLLSEAQLVEPKTERSRRTLAVPPMISKSLRAHGERQDRERANAGQQCNESGLVFTTPIVTPLDGTAVTKSFHQVRGGAGLPSASFTTCATRPPLCSSSRGFAAGRDGSAGPLADRVDHEHLQSRDPSICAEMRRGACRTCCRNASSSGRFRGLRQLTPVRSP